MRVLFVCSGNNKSFQVIPFIKEQAESLRKLGIDVEYFSIKGKGFQGYIKAGLKLKRILKRTRYDLIHAHYTLSGWTAVIGAGNTPIVLSLMGSDTCGTFIGVNKISIKSRLEKVLTKCIQPFVSAIISKSPNIEQHVYLKRKSYIIPNGININKFVQKLERDQLDLNLHGTKRKILFLGNRNSIVKNYPLVKAALEKIDLIDIELLCPYPIPHDHIPKYLNAVDILVLSSLNEGSPNVIKEAMACNCPIVSTDVGDVRWIIGDTKGCYISSFDVDDFALNIRLALDFAEKYKKTNGIERIIELGLDSENIAKRVLNVYDRVLSKYHPNQKLGSNSN